MYTHLFSLNGICIQLREFINWRTSVWSGLYEYSHYSTNMDIAHWLWIFILFGFYGFTWNSEHTNIINREHNAWKFVNRNNNTNNYSGYSIHVNPTISHNFPFSPLFHSIGSQAIYTFTLSYIYYSPLFL